MKRFRKRLGRAGFTLIEVTLAMVVFLMMTMVFAAVFPVAIRASRMSNNYAQAALITQHKIDELRGVGFDGLVPNSSKFSTLPSLGYIDTPTTTPSSLPYTVYFTNADNLVADSAGPGYFPNGAVGQITVKDYSTVDSTMSGATGNVDMVTISITWPGGAGAGGSYTASALIVSQHSE
jgi:prepilin-type N-terminal cleavage/methylation domain-containing protein